MREFLRRLKRDTEGATAVEYGLILALVFLAMLAAVQALGGQSTTMWTHIASSVTNASGT